jgi:hypothetical protein
MTWLLRRPGLCWGVHGHGLELLRSRLLESTKTRPLLVSAAAWLQSKSRLCTTPGAASEPTAQTTVIPRNEWTPEEDKLLQTLVERHGPRWALVAKELNCLLKKGLERSPSSCAMRYKRTLNPSILRNPWTPEEDATILKLHREIGPRWAEIARRMATLVQETTDSTASSKIYQRTDKQILDRFREKLNPQRKSTRWTYAEDQQLKALVKEQGPGRWTAIAAKLPGRTAKDCQLHWRRCLDPRISRSSWTIEEDEKLKLLVSRHGRRWALISKLMGNRSDIQCMHRWSSKLDPSIRRGPWTPLEDQALIEAYAAWQKNTIREASIRQLRIRGHRNVWIWAARAVPELHGRSSSQCRQRFMQLAASRTLPQELLKDNRHENRATS